MHSKIPTTMPKVKPELDSVDNPGMFSKIPTTMPKPAVASPFGDATSSATPIGDAQLPGTKSLFPKIQGNEVTSSTNPNVKLVSGKQEPSLIQAPDSPVPGHKVTLQSVKDENLLPMVKQGNMEAVREWDRRGHPRPEGVGYLSEPNSPIIPWRNYNK
jgi:hypothetical protein